MSLRQHRLLEKGQSPNNRTPVASATHHQHFDRFPKQFLVQLVRLHRSALPDHKIPQSFPGFTEISGWKPFLSRQASPQAHEATAMSGEPDGTQSMCELTSDRASWRFCL
jgi:hypothetical protein